MSGKGKTTEQQAEQVLGALSTLCLDLKAIDRTRDEMQARRDALIRDALNLGVPGRKIGAAAGLSHPRVYKVGNLSDHRNQTSAESEQG